MPFGDWNGDGDVSAGEALGTATLLSGIAGSGGSGDPGDGEPPERLLAGSADPLEAAGAAYALQKKNRGGVAVAALASPSDLDRTIDLAMRLNLPLVLLLNCREADVNDISSRVMAAEMECIPADGRSVMKLMPALRLAVDKAREGDGPTLIECVSDQLSEEEDSPDDPLERLNSMLIFEGYATPEELK